MAELHSIVFSPAKDQAAFSQIPTASGIFLLRGEDGEPYVSKTANLRRRISRLLAPEEQQGISKRLNLRQRCKTIEYCATASDFENTLLLYRLLRQHFPQTYSKRMRLKPPALVRVDWENAYPRAYITRKQPKGKLGSRAPVHFGPFRSYAAAEKYLNDALDLFKSRRCTFELAPDPAFPGCVYSEMKMCLAPCFKGCTDAHYMAEVERAQEFFETRGESLLTQLSAQREQASADLEFENAAALHARIEKVKAVVRESDELVHRLDQLDCVIIQPSLEADSVQLYRFHGGQFLGPQAFSTLGMMPARANAESGDSSLFGQPILMQPVPEGGAEARPTRTAHEERLAETIVRLQTETKPPQTAQVEQLAILNRWFHRTHKTGEIFFCEEGKWPLRKMINAVGRVFAFPVTQQAGGR
jgi:excinuclease ABC subunit C